MSYTRKTKTVYEVQGNYGCVYGFEVVTSEETYKEARERLKEYRENERGIAFKIVRKFVKLNTL